MISRPNSPQRSPGSPTVIQPLSFVQPDILTYLKHLDLSEYVVLKETKVVSLGSYGDILRERCTLPGRGEMKLAVKRLRFYLKEDIKMLFEKEIYVWAKLNHSNVLPLIGFAFESSTGYPLLISEWMANGSASKYVKRNPNCDLKQFVIGAAEGLVYLHRNGVIHSDLKPDNIVVNASGDACICDFGGSRIIAATNSLAKPTTGLRGTSCYLAYELIKYSDAIAFKGHTKESDVWAFGMTIFALLTLEDPYEGLMEVQVSMAIANKEIPVLPPSDSWSPERLEAKEVLWNACQLCWDHNPANRADMPMVLDKLRELSSQANFHKLLSSIAAKLGVIVNAVDDISETLPYLSSALEACSSLLEAISVDLIYDKRIIKLARIMDEAFGFVEDEDTLRKTTRILETLITHLLRKTLECFTLFGEYAKIHSSDTLPEMSAFERVNSFVQSLLEYKNAITAEISLYKAMVAERTSQEVDAQFLRQRLKPDDMPTYDLPTCLEHTQADVRRRIVDWMNAESGPNILWLWGIPGTGKSTISMTIAEYFRDMSRLGAFVFFERGTNEPGSVIPTIAFKLALFDSTIGVRIAEQVGANKDIASVNATFQFDKLLSSTTSGKVTSQAPFIIILDALDKYGSPEDRVELLELIKHDFSKLPSYFRFLITSRPEHDIISAFSSHQDSIRSIELDHNSDARKKDVLRYIDLEMRRIFAESELDVPEEWPWNQNMELLANTASGMFGWASEAVTRVSTSDDPFCALEDLISESTPAS